MYDYDGLRKEILDYLYTEACFMPASLIETVEVDNMSDAELIDKAKELGIDANKYRRWL